MNEQQNIEKQVYETKRFLLFPGTNKRVMFERHERNNKVDWCFHALDEIQLTKETITWACDVIDMLNGGNNVR